METEGGATLAWCIHWLWELKHLLKVELHSVKYKSSWCRQPCWFEMKNCSFKRKYSYFTALKILILHSRNTAVDGDVHHHEFVSSDRWKWFCFHVFVPLWHIVFFSFSLACSHRNSKYRTLRYSRKWWENRMRVKVLLLYDLHLSCDDQPSVCSIDRHTESIDQSSLPDVARCWQFLSWLQTSSSASSSCCCPIIPPPPPPLGDAEWCHTPKHQYTSSFH